ncbi:unnamed protein product [Ilex paraguariensis]|uniref:RanBP2-type domain-containing protein n=1 Tax=Ilex paraguariensis TaxID=185542 RepID=A0ABC8RPR6_9AQUA
MVSETLRMSRLTNGESENNLHSQRDQNGVDSGAVLEMPTRHASDSGHGNMQPDVISVNRRCKKARRQKDMTLEDMYNNQDGFDNDDDDDSDWEPLRNHLAVVTWYCVNCTMVNVEGVVHCDVCGEHKESGILRHGFFASPFSQEAGLTQNELEIIERSKGGRT